MQSTIQHTASSYKTAAPSGKIMNLRAGIISADTVIFDSFSPNLGVRSVQELSVTAHAKCYNFVA